MNDSVFKKIMTFSIKQKMTVEKSEVTPEILCKLNDFSLKYNFSKKYNNLGFPSDLFDCYIYKNSLSGNDCIDCILLMYKLDYIKNGTKIKNGYIYAYYYKNFEVFTEFVKNSIKLMELEGFECVTCLDNMDNNGESSNSSSSSSSPSLIENLRMKAGSCMNYYVFNEEVENFSTNIYNF